MRDYLRLIRWQNLLFVGILIWVMEKWVVSPLLEQIRFGEVLPWWLMVLLMMAAVLTAAGGYIINDYFDVKIDLINRPDKMIVTNTVSKDQAMLLYRVVTIVGAVAGLVVAWYVRSLPLGMIYVMIPGLLWFYSSSYKRQFIVGNLIIAFVSAVAPLTVALANVAYLSRFYAMVMPYLTIQRDILVWVSGFALFAFLTTWIREMIKDLEDQHGDRELECHTFPVVLGDGWTKVVITLLIAVTVGLIAYLGFWALPFPHHWMSLHCRYIVFGMFVPFACELWLLWAAKVSSEYRHAQLLMKFIMFLGVLYAFIIPSNL